MGGEVPYNRRPMRVAVVTPYFDESIEWLKKCHESVLAQTHASTHFLVADGKPRDEIGGWQGQHIILRHPSADWGNTPRMAGGLSAASQQFDAICFLDADCWYESNHVASLVELHQRTGAELCTALRRLVRVSGDDAGPCPLVDGVKVVDANTLFLTRTMYAAIGVWTLLPKELARTAPQSILAYAHARKRTVETTGKPTVAYRVRTRAFHDDSVIEEATPALRDDLAPHPLQATAWWRTLKREEQQRYLRIVGIV